MNNTKKTLLDIIKVSNRQIEYSMEIYEVVTTEDDIVDTVWHLKTSTGSLYVYRDPEDMYRLARELQSYIIEECIFESIKDQIML
jgi:hypothetical protein